MTRSLPSVLKRPTPKRLRSAEYVLCTMPMSAIDRCRSQLPSRSTTRLSLLEPSAETIKAIGLLRPLVVRCVADGRYEAIGNLDAYDLLADLAARLGDPNFEVMTILVDRDATNFHTLAAVEREALPCLLGQLSTRDERKSIRNLREAGQSHLLRKPRRVKLSPMVRPK